MIGEEFHSHRFTLPRSQILTMVLLTFLVAVGVYLIYPSLDQLFLESPYLNGVIVAVFVVGLATCFGRVVLLFASVNWIEGFVRDRPGHEIARPPRLLVPLAELLRPQGARSALTTFSARSILDTVATRLDEGREITRYIINLLIFLGLLGTFYGLATSVPAVVDTIRSLAPSEDGASTVTVFENLINGLERQLGGMGTAFGSSLLGLAGSLRCRASRSLRRARAESLLPRTRGMDLVDHADRCRRFRPRVIDQSVANHRQGNSFACRCRLGLDRSAMGHPRGYAERRSERAVGTPSGVRAADRKDHPARRTARPSRRGSAPEPRRRCRDSRIARAQSAADRGSPDATTKRGKPPSTPNPGLVCAISKVISFAFSKTSPSGARTRWRTSEPISRC